MAAMDEEILREDEEVSLVFEGKGLVDATMASYKWVL